MVDNRNQYRTKLAQVTPVLAQVLDVKLPDASFYLWAGVPAGWLGDDAEFAKALYESERVTVLPGRYRAELARIERAADGSWQPVPLGIARMIELPAGQTVEIRF